ncbi:MAG: M48 family peptidase [Rickettsiales bacterium TMED254]|nr:hypothetical protein [Rickettsiales bacterium]RPF78254.1 MAG: M48 family peptidase [Rickettsiales bacterium TMED254]
MFELLNKFYKIENLDFKKFTFPIIIKKSNRRSIALIVRDAKLFIRCSYLTPNYKLKEIINDKRVWIDKNIKLQLNKKESLEKRSKDNIFLLYGKKKKMILKKNIKNSVEIKDDKIFVSGNNLNKEQAHKILIDWYKQLSISLFKKKIEFYSTKMKLKINNFFIKDYKSKWGLCSNVKKEIFLNWRLVMAPISVIDYVVVHELCHIIESNHSKNFWNEVEKNHPNYKKDREWLKKNGFLLFF